MWRVDIVYVPGHTRPRVEGGYGVLTLWAVRKEPVPRRARRAGLPGLSCCLSKLA